jgi:biopolymer transport protein ExbD
VSRVTRLLLASLAIAALTACGSRRGPLITVDAQGAVAVNGEPATLAGLADVPALRDAKEPVRIRVSAEATYVHVDSLQKALQRMGVKRVVFERGK